MKGKIKRLVRERGFGFITSDDGTEVFFHRSALQDTRFEVLEEGDAVEFDSEEGPKGLRAANIKVTK